MAKLGLEDALKVIATVIERTIEAGYPPPPYVVLLGGTALAAHGVRAESEDVDFFAPELYEEILLALEPEFRNEFGISFKIDGTTGENIWSDIIFRDIEGSPPQGALTVERTTIAVKALRLEDVFITKIFADRLKDRADLQLLRNHIGLDQLISRLNHVIRWHGNRSALPGFLDHCITVIGDLYGERRTTLIGMLNIPGMLKEMLLNAGVENDDGGR